VIWRSGADVRGALVPHTLEGIEPKDKSKLWFGHDFKDDFPKDLRFTADPNYPRSRKLIDHFGNTESVFPVSPRLKAFLEEQRLPDLQFIPVEMLDHKRQVLATYYLMHLTALIDCIDIEKSDACENKLRQGTFRSVDKLVLDERRIPADARLFRIARLYNAVAVRRDLANQITEAGFVGVAWREVAKYEC
jgi:hypothetical protein